MPGIAGLFSLFAGAGFFRRLHRGLPLWFYGFFLTRCGFPRNGLFRVLLFVHFFAFVDLFFFVDVVFFAFGFFTDAVFRFGWMIPDTVKILYTPAISAVTAKMRS